jgi:hypothetical protein
MVDTILHNAKIATNSIPSFVEAIAIQDGKISATGKNDEILRLREPATRVIDAKRRTVIPGLNDSHMHPIRGGLNFNMELRWDGVPSLADALRMLKEQASRTPPPQWVRVVGGWTEFQFAEGRMPTLDEINAAAPDTPVFVLYLYDRALLNGAVLRVVGYTKDTPAPPAREIQYDSKGNPTGLLIAMPNANILYSTLAKGPKVSPTDQMNSTRLFMRELNRFGITSAIDAGGGFQNYPDDCAVISELHRRGEITVRLAYNLFTQKPKGELSDFQKWTKMTKPGEGDDFYRVNGAGEMLVSSAADFEDFLQPRPDMAPVMESELKAVIRHLVENRWPFRLHTTYNETIERALNVYEQVNREIPFDGQPRCRWNSSLCCGLPRDSLVAILPAPVVRHADWSTGLDGPSFDTECRDASKVDLYLEEFVVESWLAHLRQHERMTISDLEVQRRIRATHLGPDAPRVTHYIAAGKLTRSRRGRTSSYI